jgi:hypothetical protein
MFAGAGSISNRTDISEPGGEHVQLFLEVFDLKGLFKRHSVDPLLVIF